MNAPRFKLALGGLLGWAPALGNGGFRQNTTGGVFYGIGTFGNQDSNLSLGTGWWFGGRSVSDRPIFVAGGQARIARRISLISEDWVTADNGKLVGVVAYGVRFLGEHLSADFAFLNPTEGSDTPLIPWVSFSVKF
jgi:hypothetical protein